MADPTCPACGGRKMPDADLRGPLVFSHTMTCTWLLAEDARLATDYEALRYRGGVLTRGVTAAESALLTAMGRPPYLDAPGHPDTVAVVSFYSPGIRQRRFPDLFPELEQ